MSTLIWSFLLSGAIAAALTPLVAAWARKRGILDVPEIKGSAPFIEELRKFHSRPTPLLGGTVIFIAFTIVLGAIAWITGAPFEGRISSYELIAVFAGGAILIVGGYFDDRYHLRPSRQFLSPLLAILLVAAVGVGVSRVTHPFGGVIQLAPWMTVIGTIVWLLGTTYTTKLLDGLDGLVTGITAIGALLIAALSLTATYYQPDVAIIAFVLAGACLGFLIFNFYPARIFLGEGGSTLCGFLLGVLAIVSGGKIATALLVLGIPAFDVALVMGSRFARTGRLFSGDRRHLHFQLLDIGFSHRGAVLMFYVLAMGFGTLTLILQARGKLIAIGILAGIVVTLAVVSASRKKKNPA